MITPPQTLFTVFTHPLARQDPEGLRHGFATTRDLLDTLELNVRLASRWSTVTVHADAWSAAELRRHFARLSGLFTMALLPAWLDDLPPSLWSLGKLAALSAPPRAPWLHLDCDALFLRPPCLSGEVVFQSLDDPADRYLHRQRVAMSRGLNPPPGMEIGKADTIFNCGLVAALTPTAAAAAGDACAALTNWTRQNMGDALDRLHGELGWAGPCMLIEQGWLSCALRNLAGALLPHSLYAPGIQHAAEAAGFVHLLAGSKKRADYMARIRERLAAARRGTQQFPPSLTP